MFIELIFNNKNGSSHIEPNGKTYLFLTRLPTLTDVCHYLLASKMTIWGISEVAVHKWA